MKPELLNGANLSYIGDAYYELVTRKYCLDKGKTIQQELHKMSVKYVSAKAHAEIIERMKEESFLTEEEVSIYKRGRNHTLNANRKNLKLGEYSASSGFEAVVGYLYLKGDFSRLDEIIRFSIETIEGKNE